MHTKTHSSRRPLFTRLLGAGVAVALISSAGFSTAAIAGGHGDARPHHRMEHLITKLDLDEAQRDQVESISAQAREQHQAIKTEYRDNLRAIHELVQAEALDNEALAGLADAQGSLHAQKVALRAETMFELLSVLTPEQREQWEALREARRGKSQR